MVDPNDFVITRKRKKYKFAKFANSPLCFEFDEWDKQAASVLEVGAGTALFSVELAMRHPEQTFVAIDVKADRLQKGAYEAESRGLKNVKFLRARADQIEQCFVKGSIDVVWLTFPDPFPKKRSASRRMTHPTYLRSYETVLSENGTFMLKHDNREFFQWSLEQLVKTKWRITQLSFDLHESDLPDEQKITTSYEKRWMNEGLSIHLVSASPASPISK